MADTVVINLRLPETLSEELSYASAKSGVPKNHIFNDIVAATIKEMGNEEHYDKEEYTFTCVRLPNEMHQSVKSMANHNYLSINAMLVQMIAKHFGDKPCHVAEDETE